MKTINLSDEDYKDLMKLAKELRTQEHDSQANPRMWTVDTKHEIVVKEGYSNFEGGDTFPKVVSSESGTSIKLEELEKELLKSCKEFGSLKNIDEEYEDYIGSVGQFEEWCTEHDTDVLSVLENNSFFELEYYLDCIDVDIVPVEEYNRHELNATFFKDDAKTHIIINGHNLNPKPHTYAFSVYRMPKMERLFGILEKLGEK